MYFWNKYPFVRLSIVFIAGILCFDRVPAIWEHWLVVGSILLTGFLISIFISHKFGFYKLRHVNGALASSLIFLMGGAFCQLKYHSLLATHYRNQDSYVQAFKGSITSPVNERTNHFRYDFQLESTYVGSDSAIQTTGKIHLYVKKDTLSTPLKYGDKLLVYGRFYPVPGPDNPSEFDYRAYLEKRSIYSHAFVPKDQIKILGSNPPSRLLQLAYLLREKAVEIIDLNIPEKRENGIAKALLLGIKDHLDNEIKQAYSSAGAMHVLAVSGLHVGIIYLLIRFVFGRLQQRGPWGQWSFSLIGVIIIWFYAMVTGLSPSVLRAATMFTMIALAQATPRAGNIYNTLGFTAFLLLLFDPNLIYAVGFQLSFAAVFGIVYLQPKFYRLLNFKLFLVDKAWSITCVSIAAQMATFPLTAYYFHQFPTYFLVSNLIVIPASFLMLATGMLMLISYVLSPTISAFIGTALGKLMWGVNEVISHVDQLPNSLIEWIYMDRTGLILTYVLVFLVFGGWYFRSFKTLTMVGFVALVFCLHGVDSNHQQSKKKELVFYEIKDKLAIDYINGHEAMLFVDNYSEDELELLAYQINPYRLDSHLKPIEHSIQTLDLRRKESLYYGAVAGHRIIVFDSTTFHLQFKKTIQADVIIVHNQAVKSIKWLKEHFEFDRLILTNKNNYFYTRNIKKQAKELGIDIYDLKRDGALILDLAKEHKKERTM